MKFMAWRSILLVMLVIGASATARAQSVGSETNGPQGEGTAIPNETPPPQVAATGEEGKKPTLRFFPALGHGLVDDLKHLPRRNTAYWFAGGGALALAVHPKDQSINRHLAGSAVVNRFWVPAEYVGSAYILLGAAGATYVIGRATDSPRARHLGMDEIEGVILAGGLSSVMKIAVRRQRPVSTDGSVSRTFSFPSGHATLTFAAATILQQHLGYRAGIPTYLVASWVAMSRLHKNVHYASDVVFGAATGIVIGRTVTWHGRNFYASPTLIPNGVGLLLASR